MTTISALIVEDSISTAGVRLTTYQLRYPRWIHSEVLTHRSFSRNASSSRAIPIKKMNEAIRTDPALPLHIGKNEPGMQSKTEISSASERAAVLSLWNDACRASLRASEDMHELFGVAKQVANRITEPHQHIDVIVTSTEFDNFFALRCHPDAEPTIQVLAWAMADAYYVNPSPVLRQTGEWHLPYVRSEERDMPIADQLVCSVARCARVSYRTHDGNSATLEKDRELHQRLLAGLGKDDGEPGHLSPFEHQATPLEDDASYSGNFRGWKQHRKTILGEHMKFNYEQAIARGWRDFAERIKPKQA